MKLAPWSTLSISTLNNKDSPALQKFIESTRSQLGNHRVLKNDSHNKMIKDVFHQMILSTDGTLFAHTLDNSDDIFIGRYSDISIAESWQSKAMQRVRVETLNSALL
jgi:hypothetical protein